MDTIVRPPSADPTARATGSVDLAAAIRLVAHGLARRVTISPIQDARRLIEAASGEAADHDVRLELIVDEPVSPGDPVGILVARSGDIG